MTLKEEISRLTSGTIDLAGEAKDVVKEGTELYADIKSHNIKGISENVVDVLKETGDLVKKTIDSCKAVKPIVNNIKNDVVNSKDLENCKKELSDLKQEFNTFKEKFEKEGFLAAIPELGKVFKEVGETVSATVKGVTDLASSVGSGIADGVNNSSVNPQIKQKADNINTTIDNGISKVEKRQEEIAGVKESVEKQLTVIEEFAKSIKGGLNALDEAKSQLNQNNSKGMSNSM